MRQVGIVVAMVLLVSGALYAFAGQGAETLVLPMEGKYGDVGLPHWTHQENLTDCTACHGLFPQETGAIDRLKAEKVLKKKQVMNNCRRCHRSLAKAGKASGPIKCMDCHTAG
ncbi:cytochrome c3 family protein [Desulfoluna sp.]|uniref:cytochrome c3 family protein n=1 Tax=Desulfoluna sp. TaxID=2045199 RepID=UPI002607C009|nr:cytochrome c3 family protein [Desulfoluna sp.]